MYKNPVTKDKEVGYVYIIKFNKDFIKNKYVMGYDKFIDMGYGKGSYKIGSTSNNFRIWNIATELYPNDDLGIGNIEIIRVIKCYKYREFEDFLHKKFKSSKCKFKLEYFDLTMEDIENIDCDNFGYIGENKTMKVIYLQKYYFFRIVNACTKNMYEKTKMLEYNNIFTRKINL